VVDSWINGFDNGGCKPVQQIYLAFYIIRHIRICSLAVKQLISPCETTQIDQKDWENPSCWLSGNLFCKHTASLANDDSAGYSSALRKISQDQEA